MVFWEKDLLLWFSGAFAPVEMHLQVFGWGACCRASILHLVALLTHWIWSVLVEEGWKALPCFFSSGAWKLYPPLLGILHRGANNQPCVPYFHQIPNFTLCFTKLSACQVVQHSCVLSQVWLCFKIPHFRDTPTRWHGPALILSGSSCCTVASAGFSKKTVA